MSSALLNTEIDPNAPLFKGRAIDWVLFALAMLSLGLLVWQNFAHVSKQQLEIIRYTDIGVCLIFGGEFFLRFYEAGFTWQYLRRNWYAVLGFIPVSLSYLHHYPWIRLFLILVRLGRAIDRILGEGFTFRLLTRVKDRVINAISGIVTIIVLDRVADVLVQGTYTENIARALATEEAQLRQMVLEKLKSDPQTGKLSWVPYHDEIVQNVITTILRVTESILQDKRTDELVANMLRVNIDQLREAIEVQEDERKELQAARRRYVHQKHPEE